ncbi:hypothetical protein P9314_09435, partial [Paenibacillus validus]|uniref:hypothetical protein n=1 Tax=Paenibacillus validus TaxID=44253 RepID=UPI002E1A2F4A|nr:hypothetical protein [Paenibacillus validus]MED4607216.1 hypothetical protein [Paenibacillus validus]
MIGWMPVRTVFSYSPFRKDIMPAGGSKSSRGSLLLDSGKRDYTKLLTDSRMLSKLNRFKPVTL